MPDYRLRMVNNALDALGAAHGAMTDAASKNAAAAVAALPGPQVTQAPADAANLARPAPPDIHDVDKPVDNR